MLIKVWEVGMDMSMFQITNRKEGNNATIYKL